MPKRNQPHDVFKWINRSAGPDACWPWTGSLNSKGMPYFKVDGKTVIAYRLAYRLVHGNDALADNQVIRHTCDNQACCNPAHHIPGTQQENMNDMKQRQRHGVPAIVVKAIRKLASEGRKYAEIAEMYGLAESSIGEIVRGETHKETNNDNKASED